MHGRSRMYDHRSSHPYNARTEHVDFSQTRLLLLAPSAKHREVVRRVAWGVREKGGKADTGGGTTL